MSRPPIKDLLATVACRPWCCGGSGRLLGGDGPVLMGIVNCTPDSFFDGGRYSQTDLAVQHGLDLLQEGAQILDIGGESTRPGALPVDAQEESRRVVPVLRALARHRESQGLDFLLSVDTVKAGVARAALAVGCDIINDISAGYADPDMLRTMAASGTSVVLNHMKGEPRTMQQAPSYQNVVSEVRGELLESARCLMDMGLAQNRICLDPGIGFGKRLEDNLDLVLAAPELLGDGFPLLYGLSRKSWIGRIAGLETSDRLIPGITGALLAALGGATVLRVHDVKSTQEALRVLAAVRARALVDVAS